MGVLRVSFLSSLALELLATLSVALVAVSVGIRLAEGQITYPVALFVLLLAPEAYLPLRLVGQHFHAAAEGLGAADRVFTILETPVPTGGSATLPPGAVRLVVDDLVVAYPDRDEPALSGVTFTAEPGTVTPSSVARVAGSRRCWPRSLASSSPPPARLSAEVGDDTSTIGDLELAAWRRRIAWLPQRAQLPAADLPATPTIAQAVTLRDPAATTDRVWAALRDAGIEDEVRALPQGLDTRLGADGSGLSIGPAAAPVPGPRPPRPRRSRPARRAHGRARSVDGEGGCRRHRPAGRSRGDRHRRRAPARPHRGRASDRPHRAAACLGSIGRAGRPCRGDAGRRGDHPTGGVVTVRHVDEARPGHPVRMLWRSMSSHRVELGGAGILGALASISAVALLGTSAWLIATAAEMPPVLTLTVAAVMVRFLALSRALFRYAERLVGHDAAFRGLTELRVVVYSSLERLAPTGLSAFGRGDLLARLVADVDAALDLPLRVVLPWAQAVLVAAGTVAFLGWLLPVSGVVIGVLSVIALALTPWLVARIGAIGGGADGTRQGGAGERRRARPRRHAGDHRLRRRWGRSDAHPRPRRRPDATERPRVLLTRVRRRHRRARAGCRGGRGPRHRRPRSDVEDRSSR